MHVVQQEIGGHAVRGAVRRHRSLAAVGVSTFAMAIAAQSAMAQTAPQAAQASIEEIVVTGSRVQRDGFSAPTPVTVVSVEQIEARAQPNIADYVNTMPAFQGSATPSTSTQSVSSGTAGINSLNLRGLGGNRTLVLFDGQRSVQTLVNGEVDVNTFPQALVSRVEVVTGGASAAYGSDAISGVVNFVLDKKYTGIKGEVSGGVTTYGDNRNWHTSLTAGIPFAADRGHLLLSGELTHKDGIMKADRPWNKSGLGTMLNPTYSATNGQPQYLALPEVGMSLWSQGGLITTGPLKGVAFGPGGVPYNFTYGDLVAGQLMRGGEWRATQVKEDKANSLDARQGFQSIFGRAAYQIQDSLEIYVQGAYSDSHVVTLCCPQYNPDNINVRADNAFLPAAIAARATALNVTTFRMGTVNPDMPLIYTDNKRNVLRLVAGVNGKFDALDTQWTWDGYFQDGISRSLEVVPRTYLKDRYALAIDAVRNPATGAIVCRSTLTTPNNGCVPYNLFGIGVNSQAVIDYLLPGYPYGPWRRQRFEQQVWALNVSGEPFVLPAGPVSLALGVEHRSEEVSGTSDTESKTLNWFIGNFLPSFGKYNVTEGYAEVVAPLASDAVWAKLFEVNGAIRATSYSTSGYVTTWKLGATYKPIDDIRLRVTRSRDIRAPNLAELFQAGNSNNNTVVDPFNNNQSTSYTGFAVGNQGLRPEKADTLGLGMVVQPAFWPGFSASFDYYNIDISDAIGSVSAQNIVNFCFQGNQEYCSKITRGVNASGVNVISRILISPFNTTQFLTRGYDLEASYRLALNDLSDSWDGDVTLRALATRTLKSYSNNSVNPPDDGAGALIPKWKFSATAIYSLDPVRFALSARGRSAGKQDNDWVMCTSGCPASNTTNITINDNTRPRTFYLDAAFDYRLRHPDTDGYSVNAFLNVRNITNAPPAASYPGPSGAPFASFAGECGNGSDCQGRVFMVGLRFQR